MEQIYQLFKQDHIKKQTQISQMQVIVTVLILFTLFFKSESQISKCPPQTIIPNLLQKKHILTISSNLNSSTPLQSAGMKQGFDIKIQPNSIFNLNKLTHGVTILQYGCEKLVQFDFKVSSQFKSQISTIKVTFQYSFMKWYKIQILTWMAQRNDVLIGTFSASTEILSLSNKIFAIDLTSEIIQNRLIGSTQTSEIQIIAKTLIPINFLTGLKLVSSLKTYQIAVKQQPLTFSDNKLIYTPSIEVGAQNVLKFVSFTYLIINPLSTQFVIFHGKYTFNIEKSQIQYHKIVPNHNPNIYNFIGLTSFRVLSSQDGFNLKASIDYNFIAQFISLSKIDQMQFQFFGLGKAPRQVCQPCDNFILYGLCVDECQGGFYKYLFDDGGKGCMACSQKINETLNQQRPMYEKTNLNGCKCMTGFQKVQGKCVQSTKCTQPNTVFQNGKCACIQGTFNTTKGCVKCKQNEQIFDQNQRECVKIVSTFKCDDPNSHPSLDNTVCSCNQKYIKNSKGICVQICKQHQQLINDKCECNNKSIQNSKGVCQQCPKGLFKQTILKICQKCSQYCQQCTKFTDCQICKTDFLFNNITLKCQQICGDGKKYILECDDGNKQNGDGCNSQCKIEAGYKCRGGSQTQPDKCVKQGGLTVKLSRGYPIFITPGILMQFQVRPKRNLTRKQVRQMVKLSYNIKAAQPKQISISETPDSDSDANLLRCFLNYENELPNIVFNAKVQFNDKLIGYDEISYTFDVFSSGISSALQLQNQMLK